MGRTEKQQAKVENVVKLTISINNQHKDTNGKTIMIESSAKQCSNKIWKLESELKAEQQKHLIECYLENLHQRNDIIQNSNKKSIH